MAFAKGGYGKPKRAAVVAPAPTPVVQAPVKPVTPTVTPLVGMIQAALGKIAQGVKSPEAVRLQTLTDAVTALQTGLKSIPMTDLAPSDKAVLTEACNAMAKEAQDLLTLNTAGDWLPYFIKSPKASVLKLQELRQTIYNMDELINGRTLTTLFKQYVYRPIKNNKMKSAMIVAAILTANKLGVLDLAATGGKLACKKSLQLGCWLVAGQKYDLQSALVAQIAKNRAEVAAPQKA